MIAYVSSVVELQREVKKMVETRSADRKYMVFVIRKMSPCRLMFEVRHLHSIDNHLKP